MAAVALWGTVLLATVIVAGSWAGNRGLLPAACLGCLLFAALVAGCRRRLPYSGHISLWTLVPACGLLVVHSFALLQSNLPPGMDASFHCTVALHFTLQDRTTADLRPLEHVRLNYPTGSHFLVAAAVRALQLIGLTLPPHVVFKLWFPISAALACLLAASFERIAGGDNGVSSAWVHAFGIFQISLYPYTWGGLPALLGMTLFLCGLLLVLAPEERNSPWLAGLCWGAAMLTHHHTGVAIAAGTVAVATAEAIRRNWLFVRSLMQALLTASLVSLPYWWRLLANLPLAHRTAVFNYVEPFRWPWEHLLDMGPVLVVGLVTIPLVRTRLASGGHVLLVYAAVWTVAFAYLDYGARSLCLLLGSTPVTPFTPSRFLFEAQWVLCPLVGARLGRLFPGRAKMALALTCLLCGVGYTWERWTATPLQDLPAWVKEGRWHRPEGTIVREDLMVAPGEYVANHSPPDTLVLGTPGLVWLTYNTRRESTGLFIPISEPVSERLRKKWALLRAPRSRSWQEWSQAFGGVPIWGILSERERLPGEQPIREWPPLRVVILWAGHGSGSEPGQTGAHHPDGVRGGGLAMSATAHAHASSK